MPCIVTLGLKIQVILQVDGYDALMMNTVNSRYKFPTIYSGNQLTSSVDLDCKLGCDGIDNNLVTVQLITHSLDMLQTAS